MAGTVRVAATRRQDDRLLEYAGACQCQAPGEDLVFEYRAAAVSL